MRAQDVWTLGLTCLVFLSAPAAGELIYVGPGGHFPEVQPAVDAAEDGDAILVHPGEYEGFSIVAKTVSVWPVGPSAPRIVGGVEVTDLATDDVVVMSGLTVEPPSTLSLRANEGAVCLQDCRISSQTTCCFDEVVLVIESPNVMFVRCSVLAPDATHSHGASAMSVGTASVAAWDCRFFGGDGADGSSGTICFPLNCEDGGDAGDGVYIGNGFGFFSGCMMLAGLPGSGGQGPGCDCYPGIHGWSLRLNHLSSAVTLSSSPPDTPGDVEPLDGRPRRLASSPTLVAGDVATVTVEGAPGEEVRLVLSDETRFELSTMVYGVQALGPATGGVALGTVPSSGILEAPFTVPALPAGEWHGVLFLQASFVDRDQSTWRLSNPIATLVLQ